MPVAGDLPLVVDGLANEAVTGLAALSAELSPEDPGNQQGKQTQAQAQSTVHVMTHVISRK
jgi:hypothetical protein